MLVGVNDDQCLNCGRRKPGLFGFAPLLAGLGRGGLDDAFVRMIVVVCGFLYVASALAGGLQMGSFLNLLSPGARGLLLFGASGAYPVFVNGHWWTVLSATWLHGGVLHILFNMYVLYQVVPTVIEFYGLSRTVIIYVLGGAAGFTLSSFVGAFLPLPWPLSGATVTIGASAALLGLIGAILCYGRRTGSTMIIQQIRIWLIYLLIMGFIPGLSVDNWSHLGGLAGGYLLAQWMDPLHPERGNHALIALVLLAATAAAIVWSVIDGLSVL